MVVDKTKRKLKIGQTVDILLVGMFHGKVIAIKDSPIALSPNQQIQPHVAIQIISTPFIRPDGAVDDVYIIAEADPNDPLIKDASKIVTH